jgi:homocysteine S-methyltransferase
MLETIEQLARATSKRLSAQPNAGRPRDIEGRNIYLCSPEYMASYARRFTQRGVRLVGGCCGTTPEHIRQIRLAVNAQGPGAARVTVGGGRTPVEEPMVAAVPRHEKSALARALAEGRFVTTVELEPPKGIDAGGMLAEARRLASLGVDAITVVEGSRGGARLSALSLATLLRQQTGIEPVLEYACRDRYLLGMQSDLLGAHAMGLRNVLIVTGDPRKRGDYSDATLVFDVDSIGLTNAVARLNRGRDVGGQSLGLPTAFHVGVVGNPTAPRLDDEVKRFEYKAEAGAEFAVTVPLFDLDALDQFQRRTAHLGVPLLVAVRPFDRLLHAEFLANEVPNLRVPDQLIERMRRADADNRAADEGLAIAVEMAQAVSGRVQGLQVGGPPATVAAVLAALAPARAPQP